ncbi:hypothetical protein Scep_015466 [Stephania cephalantha]|uniref:DUF4283 domain-containing protein n=1 Tax=Stephania cephalantha TaxID=152367 RepID=A0AAP0J413_9MAGN
MSVSKGKGVRSSEEDDLLDRSTKKSKLALVMVQKESTEGVPTVMTYKDKLASLGTDAVDERAKRLVIGEHIKGRIYGKWQRSLIVKLLANTASFTHLAGKFRTLWMPTGEMELNELDHGFIIAKFVLDDNYLRVLAGGPWVVSDHYMGEQRWKPGFNPLTESFS